MSTGREIRLVENPDGWWTARDIEAGVSTQGETREAALAALDGVVAAMADDTAGATDEDDTPRDPLGTRLRGRAAEVDIDPVAAVRELREDV